MKEYVKMNRRIIVHFILVLVSTVMIFCDTSLAATVYTEGDYYYELRDEAIVITGYFGSDDEITLPDKIAGYPVSKIASGAFVNTRVKVINLPDTIMEIEENAIGQGVNVVYMSDNADAGNMVTATEKPKGDSDKNAVATEKPKGNSDNKATATEKPKGNSDNKATATEKPKGNSDNKAIVTQKPKGEVGNNTTSVDNNMKDKDNDTTVTEDLHVEEADISLSDEADNKKDNIEDRAEYKADNNAHNNAKDNAKGIKTDDDKYTIRIDKEQHLIIEDSEGKTQVIDDMNEYAMTTEDDGTVTIQNQEGEKVSVDSDGTIKAGNNTIAKIEKDGKVKVAAEENTNWLIIIVVLGIVCVIVAVTGVLLRRNVC